MTYSDLKAQPFAQNWLRFESSLLDPILNPASCSRNSRDSVLIFICAHLSLLFKAAWKTLMFKFMVRYKLLFVYVLSIWQQSWKRQKRHWLKLTSQPEKIEEHMLKVSYLFPEVHNCCKNRALPAPLVYRHDIYIKPTCFYLYTFLT